MNLNFSKTTVMGVIGLLIIVTCLTLLVLGRMTVAECALAIAALGGAAGKVGLLLAKDDNAPDTLATVTTTQGEGRASVAINTTVERTDRDVQ